MKNKLLLLTIFATLTNTQKNNCMLKSAVAITPAAESYSLGQFEIIPEEVLIKILEELKPEEAFQVALTSKYFNILINADTPNKDSILMHSVIDFFKKKWGTRIEKAIINTAVKKFFEKTLLHPKIIYALKTAGSDINTTDITGSNSLCYACHEETIRHLVKNGAKINAQDNRGDTILHKHIIPFSLYNNSNGHTLIKTLLELKADLYRQNLANETPLSISIRFTNPQYHKLFFMQTLGVEESILRAATLCEEDTKRKATLTLQFFARKILEKLDSN